MDNWKINVIVTMENMPEDQKQTINERIKASLQQITEDITGCDVNVALTR